MRKNGALGPCPQALSIESGRKTEHSLSLFYNQILQIGQLIQRRKLFLTVLDAWKSKIKVPASGFRCGPSYVAEGGRASGDECSSFHGSGAKPIDTGPPLSELIHS